MLEELVVRQVVGLVAEQAAILAVVLLVVELLCEEPVDVARQKKHLVVVLMNCLYENPPPDVRSDVVCMDVKMVRSMRREHFHLPHLKALQN